MTGLGTFGWRARENVMRRRSMSKLSRLPAFLLVAVLAVVLAGCGGSPHKHPAFAHPAFAPQPCPQASSGHGHMGLCTPKQELGLERRHFALAAGPLYPDLSNNDPCVCGSTIRARGQVGLIVKANQGTGFVDGWGVPMVQSARAAGLAVGMYDFDQDYSIAEAQVFVSRLHAAGIYPTSPNTFPAYFDVEYGNFSYGGLLAQIAYVHGQGYRVGIYTGDWYWGPHVGCQWPSGLVSAWLSGYPNAPIPCGTQNYNAHQFTSSPIDLSVYLGSLDQFHAFVNAGPPPDPFAVFPKTVFQFGSRICISVGTCGPKDHASEYNTAKTWHLAGCLNPVIRKVCKTTHEHLVLLLGRDYFVAFHAVVHGHWVTLKHPRWGFPSKAQPLGSRAALIRADLRQR